jgi:peptide/nickel transport system substrate-binding protein
MSLRSRLPLAVLAASALFLSGCTAASDDAGGDSATPVADGVLTYASGDAEPTCLDPHVGGNYPQALLATQVLESLVSREADGTITPWLAESWTVSDDALSYDFTLREGVEFTDGTPLDAEAVAGNIAHLQDPATKSSTGYLAVAKVESVTAVSPNVARFTLSAPDSALLESLAQPWTAIQSPTGIARGEAANCEAPVGTGPFTVTEWVKQDHVTLTRNDAYDASFGPTGDGHEGPAYLSSIEWRFLPDSATRYAALQAGEVDVIDNAQPDTLQAATEASDLVELDAPRPGSVNRLELNSGQSPFDDAGVREAFLRAVGVNDAIDSLFFGTAERSYSPLSSSEATAYSDASLFEDAGSDDEVAAAEELLETAGWTDSDGDGIREKDGQPLTLRFPVSTNQSISASTSRSACWTSRAGTRPSRRTSTSWSARRTRRSGRTSCGSSTPPRASPLRPAATSPTTRRSPTRRSTRCSSRPARRRMRTSAPSCTARRRRSCCPGTGSCRSTTSRTTTCSARRCRAWRRSPRSRLRGSPTPRSDAPLIE